MAASDITWTAHLGTTETEDQTPVTELVVTRDIRAGICGPFVVQTFPAGVSLSDVEVFLASYGLTPQVGNGWTATSRWNGLTLQAGLDMA